MTREELEDKLTDANKHFCREYLLSWNKVRSYMKAYPRCSYDSASSSAIKLLKNPRIKEYMQYLKGDIEELTGVSKIRNINELAKIAYCSIAELHNTWIDLKVFEELTADQKAAIESIETQTVKRKEGIYDDPVEVLQVKIKLHAKKPALEEINKMMGYNAPEEKVVQLNTTKIKWGDSEIEI